MHIHPQTPPCPRKRGTWCWCSTLVTAFTALPPPSRGKAVLDLPLFVICTIHVYTKYDLRKFAIVSGLCIKIRTCRSENISDIFTKLQWRVSQRVIFKGGWGQHFQLWGRQINDSLGPPGVRPPGYTPVHSNSTWTYRQNTPSCDPLKLDLLSFTWH